MLYNFISNTRSNKSTNIFSAISMLLILAFVNPAMAAPNTAPELTVLSPSHDSHFEESDRILFSAVATDKEDGNLDKRIKWTSDIDGKFGSGPNVNASLSKGTHNISATVIDRRSAVTTVNLVVNVGMPQEPNTAPNLTILSPENRSTHAEGSDILFSAQSIDTHDGDLTDSIEWRVGGIGEIGTGGYFTAKLPKGQHRVTVMSFDSEGLSTKLRFDIFVETQTENAAPSIMITSPANGSQFEEGQQVNFTATASDNEDGDISDQIQWASNVDGQLGNGASFLTQLSLGNHTVTATVSDSGDLTDSAAIAVTVIEAPTGNTAPVVTITSPANGDQFDPQQAVTFTASADDAEDGDLSATIKWYSNLDGLLGTGAVIDAQLTSGNHVVTASVSDSGDLSASDSVNLTEQATGNGMATVSWTAPSQNTDGTQLNDLTGYKVYYGTDANNLTEVKEVNDPQASSVVIEGLNADATYYFCVTAVNSYGVESEFSNQVSKLVR